MENQINKKIPVSSIILPILYAFSGFVCFLFSSEIYSESFQVISVFNPEFNIVKIGSFHIIYAFIIRIVYTKSLTTYFSIIPFLALYEFVTFGLDIYLFTFNQVAHILYTAVFHFGLFILLIYERRIFK